MNKHSEALLSEFESEKRELIKKSESINLNHDAEEDYEKARNTLTELLDQSGEAMAELLELAREAEHARIYEVLGQLIKTRADLGDQLMSLQKKRHELDTLNNPDKQISRSEGGTTNNVFIGSTNELQRFLKEQQSENVIDVNYDD